MKKKLDKAKNLFALAFALCMGGIIIQSNPEYLINFLNFIQLGELVPNDANKANKFIQLYAAAQSLLGGSLLTLSGLWIHKMGKNNSGEINHE